MMDPEHSTEIYNEDFKKLGVDHLFFAEPQRLVHTTGEIYDNAIQNAKKTIEKYEALGYECGLWITTLGYGGALFATAQNNKT